MKAVAARTGISSHTIRAWERRYGALSPARTPTNRRLYSAEDVEKLVLMRRAAEAGHSVGQIAGLTIEELRRLARAHRAARASIRSSSSRIPPT